MENNFISYGSKRANQIYTVLMSLALICSVIGIFGSVYIFKIWYTQDISFSYYFNDIIDLTNYKSFVGDKLYPEYTSRLAWYYIDNRIVFYILMLVVLVFGTMTIINCIKTINGYSNIKVVYPLLIFGSIMLVLLFDSFLVNKGHNTSYSTSVYSFGVGPIFLQIAVGFITIGFIFKTIAIKDYGNSKKINITKIILKTTIIILVFILFVKIINPNVYITRVYEYGKYRDANWDASIFKCYLDIVANSVVNDDINSYYLSTFYMLIYLLSFMALIVFFVFVILDKEEYIIFMLPISIVCIIFSTNELIKMACSYTEKTETSLLNSFYVIYGIAIFLSIADIVINQIINREKTQFIYIDFDEVNY